MKMWSMKMETEQEERGGVQYLRTMYHRFEATFDTRVRQEHPLPLTKKVFKSSGHLRLTFSLKTLRRDTKYCLKIMLYQYSRYSKNKGKICVFLQGIVQTKGGWQNLSFSKGDKDTSF